MTPHTFLLVQSLPSGPQQVPSHVNHSSGPAPNGGVSFQRNLPCPLAQTQGYLASPSKLCFLNREQQDGERRAGVCLSPTCLVTRDFWK